MDAGNEILEVIQSLPLVKTLIDRFGAFLYGGFLRCFFEKNSKASDVDVYCATENPCDVIQWLHTTVTEAGGIIEYGGKGYETKEEYQPFNPTKLTPTGLYNIWMLSKGDLIRLDVTVTFRDHCQFDFTVNSLRLFKQNDKYYIASSCSYKTDEVIQHINDRIIIPMKRVETSLKRLLRSCNLIKKGYYPCEQMIRSYELFLTWFRERYETDIYKSNELYCLDRSKPSRMSNTFIINPSMHHYITLTPEMVAAAIGQSF